MTASMGLLLVWDAGALPRPRAETVIADAMGSPLPAMSADVLDAGRWMPDGVVAFTRSPMGFDLISVRWSPGALGRSDALTARRMDAIEAVARRALDELRPSFGYLSHYGDHFDDPWIEQRVLVPLLAEDWDDLISSLYHLVILGAPLAPAAPGSSPDGATPRVPIPDRARVIHASDAGCIVRLGEHRSPFGPLDAG